MQVIALVTALSLAADPTDTCRAGLLVRDAREATAPPSAWPTEKLLRPLVLPPRAWALSTAGVYSGALSPSGAVHAAGAVVGVAMSPTCNLEIGIETGHLLTPPLAFTDLAPNFTLALTGFAAISLGSNFHLQPNALGLRSAEVWLGAPLRLRVNDWFGLVGLERALAISLLWGDTLRTVVGFSVSLPFGVLFQPTARLSFQAGVRPVVSVVPFAFSGLELEVEALFAPIRSLDLVFASYVRRGPVTTGIVASVGVRLRLLND